MIPREDHRREIVRKIPLDHHEVDVGWSKFTKSLLRFHPLIFRTIIPNPSGTLNVHFLTLMGTIRMKLFLIVLFPFFIV